MQQLTGLDQMFLSLDGHTTNAILGGLCRFEKPAPGQPVPDEPFMRTRLNERLVHIPPFTKRLVPVPLALDNSYLAEVDRIDVGRHVRTVRLPAPGDNKTLAAEVSRIMGTDLVTDGPLWEYIIFEGLEDGGVAHMLRIDHGVVDGSTMPKIWDLIADEPLDGIPDAPPQRTLPQPLFGKPEMAVRALYGLVKKPVQMVKLEVDFVKWAASVYKTEGILAAPSVLTRLLPGKLGGGLTGLINMRHRAKGTPELTQYLRNLTTAPATTFNGRTSAKRHFVFDEMPLGEVKAVGKKAGATLNNTVVTIVAGAVRRYMEDHGGAPNEPIIVCCPVSLRHDNIKEPWSNHVHMMFAELPVHESDPLKRLALVSKDLVAAKQSFDRLPTHLIRDASRFIPREFFGAMVKLWIRLPDNMSRAPWNVVVSNVRGAMKPMHMNGLEIAGFWPASFLSIGGGINITLQSHVDRICFGFIGAPEKTGDLWPLTGYMQDALVELRDAVDSAADAAKAVESAQPAGAKELAAADAITDTTLEQITTPKARTRAPAKPAEPSGDAGLRAL